MATVFSGKVLALSGGVGGAKLARGLAGVLAPEQLTVVANTGDDFDYWGLRICPDLDSILYALADMNDPERGWGLRDESWRALAAMRRLGEQHWFQLGDQDLATHLLRSKLLAEGKSLSQVTAALCRALAVPQTLLPMTEDAVRTQVETERGWLDFQQYFVAERCEPALRGLAFAGVENAELNPLVMDCLRDRDLRMIILCPSNPLVSIDPILSLPGCREALREATAPVVAVSPIINGRAVKGPAAKMMRELNIPTSAAAVAHHYRDFLDVFVLDDTDAGELAAVEESGVRGMTAPILMSDLDSKLALAGTLLNAVAGILH